MAIRDLSNNKSKDMFLDRTLLLNLYYYELNITHISKIEVKDIENEYMEELANLNIQREKLKTIKKPHLIRRALGGVLCALGLCGVILIPVGVTKKLFKTPGGPIFTDDTGKSISSDLLIDKTEMGLYVTEYEKTDDNHFIVKEYKISDSPNDNKYYNKLDGDKLYNVELTDDMLTGSKLVSVDDMKGFHYENRDSYRTVTQVYSSFNPESAAIFSFFPVIILIGATLGGLVLLEEFEEEYRKTKTLSNKSLEKLKGLLTQLRNTVAINNPGTIDVSELENKNFRI